MLPVQAKHTFINVIFTQIRLFFVGRFVCYHFVLAKRQFVAMHYSCFCVKLLFLHIVQRPHPTPILQDESCVNLKISKTIGKTKETKETKEAKAKTIKKTSGKPKNTKKGKTFRPMSAKVDMGLKVFFVSHIVFDSCCLDLFGFFGFPNGF